MSDALLANLLRFVDLLRAAGVSVHAGRMTDAATAMEHVGVARRADLRAALRCLLVRRHDDIPRFDEVFDRFWRTHGDATLEEGRTIVPRDGGAPGAAGAGSDAQLRLVTDTSACTSEAPVLRGGAWSARESLKTRDFATLTPAELAQAEALLARMPWRLGVRRTRRWVRARRGRVDLRPLTRVNMKHGGELVVVPRRARRRRPRPVVVLADISGSMERYARMLLQFVHGMTAAAHDVESFVFATRLTRITRDLARGGGQSLPSAVHRIQDWGGGTRIGGALRAFNLHYARRVMRHGPIVLLISDGWDRGDPEELARELARVRRSCRRLVWLNPLLGSEAYEPLTRGMQAALPLIDDFLPAHNLASLGELARHLRRLDRHAD